LLEAGYKCSMLRCTHEHGLDIHHIDLDPSNNSFDNLIVLCAVHHRMATEGKSDKKPCRTLKEISVQQPIAGPAAVEELSSRKEYVETALSLLRGTHKTYRATVVGPLFLHPAWYVQRRAKSAQLPDYESEVHRFISARPARTHDIRLILRNCDRYRDKVDQFVRKEERSFFRDCLLKAIEEMWGQNGERGPDLCCVDTGYLRVELIFDNGMIASHRGGPKSPISGGQLWRDPEVIRNERARFDAVFDGSSRGQASELDELRNFVVNLW
jgi:hypothetical protein